MQRTATKVSERDTARIKALEAQHLQEQEEMHAIWESLEEQKSTLTTELSESERQLKNLARELERLKKKTAQPVKVDQRLIKHIRAALRIHTNITIHSDTADTVASHFPDPRALYETLTRLNEGEKMPAKKLRGIRGHWFELDKHINTGSSDMGRLYFRELEGKKYIVVHRKKDDGEQRKFIENLANPRFIQDRPFDE